MDTIPVKPEYELLAPSTPAELGFPHNEWWPGQRMTVGRLIAAFNEGYDAVLLNAPTGSGKTLIGSALGVILSVPTTTMTHTIALQKQYRKTAPWAFVSKGKRNYPCGRSQDGMRPAIAKVLGVGELNAEQCDDHLECENPWLNGCPYFESIHAAAESDQVVLNYAYALRICQSQRIKRGMCYGEEDDAQPNPFRRELAILDEGHLANNAIVQACAVELWHRSLNRVGLDVPRFQGAANWQVWARDEALPTAQAYDAGDDVVVQTRVRNLVGRLQALATGITAEDWIVQPGQGVTKIQPLWSRSVYHRFLAYFPKLLIMSATLGDPELLSSRLGLESRKTGYVDVDSTFPKENRPSFYWPVVKLSSKSDDGDYATLASAIQYIVQQPRLAVRKGIVHTPSYKLVSQIRQHMDRDDPTLYIFHEEPQHRDSCVKTFRDADYPLVLVTPSLATGFDLPYEIGWQIIAKVPFGDLGDPVVRAQREYQLPDNPNFGKRCYDDDALNQVVQAVGRAVRAPDDEGVSYILDSNFWGLYKRAHSPGHFKETLAWLN